MQTHNKLDIINILNHPAILPRVSNVPEKATATSINTAKSIFLIDDSKQSLAILENTGEFHIQVLPEARKNAGQFHADCIGWIKDNTDFIKLTAQVPFLYMDVVNFGIKNGWLVEGINRNSYLKDGKIYDKYYLGYSLL